MSPDPKSQAETSKPTTPSFSQGCGTTSSQSDLLVPCNSLTHIPAIKVFAVPMGILPHTRCCSTFPVCLAETIWPAKLTEKCPSYFVKGQDPARPYTIAAPWQGKESLEAQPGRHKLWKNRGNATKKKKTHTKRRNQAQARPR